MHSAVAKILQTSVEEAWGEQGPRNATVGSTRNVTTFSLVQLHALYMYIYRVYRVIHFTAKCGKVLFSEWWLNSCFQGCVVVKIL